jgi:acyl carrier protein
MNIWPLILFGSVLFLVGVWVYERLPRWRADDERARREPLTEAQFGERFFTAELSPIAARLRSIAAEQLGKDLSQLHPDDRLALAFFASSDSLDSVELLMAIEEEFGIELNDDAVTKMETFHDLVAAVAAQRPFLSEWRRKLSRAIEAQFGVSLRRETLATVATPLALSQALAGELKVQTGAEPTCQTQRAFYLLRDELTRTLHRARRSIAPATALCTLIPWRTRRFVWPQLRDAVAARNWPALVRPSWIKWLTRGLPLLGGVAVALGLPPLADWVSRQGSSLGFALHFASEVRLLVVIPLMIFAWVLLVRVSNRLCWAFPRGIRTVGDLVPFVITSAQMTWTGEQLDQKVRDIVVTQLGLPTEPYQVGGRFVEEFGLEVAPEGAVILK